MISRSLSFWIGFIVGIVVSIILIAYAPPCADVVPARAKPITYSITSKCFGTDMERRLKPIFAESRRLMMRDGWEYGGMIVLSPDGLLCVSPPASSRHPTSMAFMVNVPKDHLLIGLYHTHPGVDFISHVFSATDVNTACETRVPSWIVVESMVVVRFTPTPERCARDPRGIDLGEFIGMVPK